MVYILSTNLKENVLVCTALCNLFGVGKEVALQLCDQLGVSRKRRVFSLTNAEIETLYDLIDTNYKVGVELRQEIRRNKGRLVKISTYRGFRVVQGLPSRGQRTHGNSRTARRLRVGQKDLS